MTVLTPAHDYVGAPWVPSIVGTGPSLIPAPPPAPTPPSPTERAPAPRYSLVAVRADSVVPLAEFRTATITEITTDMLGLGEHRHRVTVAVDDPAWPVAAARLWVESDGATGVPIGELVERVEWQIWRDGEFVTAGFSDGPVKSGATIDLQIAGGGAMIRDRYLGSGVLTDYLGGRGKFLTGTALSGWTVGPSWSWGTDNVFQGVRALRLVGSGFVITPWSSRIRASSTHELDVYGNAVVRATNPRNVSDGTGGIVQVRNVATGQIVSQSSATERRSAGKPELTAEYRNKWQSIEARAEIPRHDDTTYYQARMVLAVDTANPFFIGEVLISVDETVGAPSNVAAGWTLERLAETIIDEGQTQGSGGSLRIDYVAGANPKPVRSNSTWKVSESTPMMAALESLFGRVDAPEVKWVHGSKRHELRSRGRFGGRSPIQLTRDTVVTADLESNTRGRWSSLRVQTGYGSGPGRIVIPVDTGTQVRPRRTVVQAPPELDFKASREWARGLADVGGDPSTLRVTVPYWLGVRVAAGDVCDVSLDVEGWRFDGPMRVGRVAVRPAEHLVVLELGVEEGR